MAVKLGDSIVTKGLILYLNASAQKNYVLSEVEVLVVAGGGGGGSFNGGGGGAGGLIYSSSYSVTPGTPITTTVGNGGVGDGRPGNGATGASGTVGTNGGNSVFGNLTAIGGGVGSTYSIRLNGVSGGSGGGSWGALNFASGTVGQGNVGGGGYPIGSNYTETAGGGGGAGSNGVSGGTSSDQPGAGGLGLLFNISGNPRFYAGGGGAGANRFGGLGVGGSGIGGNGGTISSLAGVAGASNTGSGGGGAAYNATPGASADGGAGGSGVVIVRYPGPQKATGGTITQVGGYTIHTFTISGTFTPLVVPVNAGAVYGLQDLSGNNNTGTAVNGPTYNTANGGAFNFDGSNDHVLTSSVATYGNNTTWEAWIYCTANVSTYNMFMGRYLPYFGFFGGNRLFFSNNISGVQSTIETATNLSLNTWYHATFTTSYNGVNTTMKIYTNGSETATGTFSGTQGNYGFKFMIGDGNNGTDGASAWYPFQGRVSSVKVYDRTLSPTEIQQNFNAQRGRFGI